MRAKDHTGLLGEHRAAEYLEQNGHHILERRWRTRTGELDLITMDDQQLVAVEVKTRHGLSYGHPFEHINDAKLRRIQRLLSEYAATHQMWPVSRRIDAVSVILECSTSSARPRAVIDHLKDLP
ncbi:YraN family protein [Nesterenkonia ebinurensis]|uniref:YraN family protein n=1 Tax=Nesterenkonia ebinurensis TaxID=2608252 RepID=UPI00123E0F6B|nr:YraN family protein [Nesterenkonia ebinurensis]